MQSKKLSLQNDLQEMCSEKLSVQNACKECVVKNFHCKNACKECIVKTLLITARLLIAYYAPVKGWTAACRLRAGDILQTVNGEYVIVEWIQHELLESPTLVYNFQVAEDHNYYVSEIELLVHNSCGPKDYSPKGSGRNGAFKQAKRDLGIPVTEQPEKILPNYNKRDVLLPGRVYLFKNGMKIRDDIYGHAFADGGKLSSHFNTIIGHYFY